MIACRSFIRVSARSCKLANTTHISSTPPLYSLQGFRSYGCLSYFTYTMDRKKKLKASKPVWRPICTHSSSQEGCLTNGAEVGNGSSPTEVANDKSEVQVEVVSDVQNVTKNGELGSEVAELSGSRTSNIEEEQVAASAYANVEAGNRVKQHSVSVEDRKKKLKTSKSVWRPISSSHEACSADVVKLEIGSSQANVANNEKSEAKVQVQAVTHARDFGKKDEITSEVVELPSSTVINVEEEQLTASADVNVEAFNTSNEARKHSVSIEVGASLICFVRGKGGSTQKQIEEETGAKLIFPSSKKESFIVIEGGSLESVIKASEKIQVILEEAVKSPALDYSHFISLPLAIHPELVDQLINFQASVLGNSDSCKDENGGSESDGHSTDSEDNEQQLDGGLDVAVKLKVEDKNEHVIVEINKIPLVSYPPKASKSLAPPDLGIDRSIFIKPKTFHLTILMLKLWNKERIAAATEVLQRVSSKVMDALEGKPVFVKLNGLESMRGSLAKARVLYTPVEVIGGQDRLLRACQIIVDAYAEAGLVLEKDAQQKLKLHGTVMNARHRKRKKGTKWSDSFDARGIVKQYGSEEWGEYLIREAHLSQRRASYVLEGHSTLVAKYKDPRDACAAIVAESYRLWLQYETRTDDITVIVVHINGLTNTGVQSTTTDSAVKCMPQIVEVKGSESPATVNWNSRNHRARNDLSRARLRAIESSLNNGQVWVPPYPSHRKTWEEEAHIERALHDHFLFRKLTDSQCHVLLDCMQRVEVHPGDVVVQQGGEGDCFYVVGSGEFEVFATQEEQNTEVPRVLQRYTAEKLSSFGELALMYNKPLQASVRAVTNGTLWALKREDFRGILMSEFSTLSSLKLLRSAELLSRLSILQLSHIADSLSEISFTDGQTIINRDEHLSALYIIRKGCVRITYDIDLITYPNTASLSSDSPKQKDDTQTNKEVSVEKVEGSHFGEWALMGEDVGYLSAVAVGDVVCALVTKEKFESAVGSLAKLQQCDNEVLESGLKDKSLSFSEESAKDIDGSSLAKVQLADLEWKKCIYSTDCCEIGLVLSRNSDNLLSLKRFSKQRIKQLGKEAQVLKEKDLMKNLSSSTLIPQIVNTCADQTHVGILLNTCLACPLACILHTPLDESSARFCAASMVVALEELHKNGVIYRGVSPDVLMFDQGGHLQLVDFRFGKKLSGERTFTICGMADSLAPEIVQGKGHGYAADWWALGVLIYFMLQAEMPFGSWRQSELDTFAKIAKGQLTLPQHFSPEVVGLITKLLEVDENERLGSQGAYSLKNHNWFEGFPWEEIIQRSCSVPHGITSRIANYLENRTEDCLIPLLSPSPDIEELDSQEWLEDW